MHIEKLIFWGIHLHIWRHVSEVCICIHDCMCTCIHVHMYPCISVSIHVCMYTSACFLALVWIDTAHEYCKRDRRQHDWIVLLGLSTCVTWQSSNKTKAALVKSLPLCILPLIHRDLPKEYVCMHFYINTCMHLSIRALAFLPWSVLILHVNTGREIPSSRSSQCSNPAEHDAGQKRPRPRSHTATTKHSHTKHTTYRAHACNYTISTMLDTYACTCIRMYV
jgi:hypothetical protein